MLRRLCPRPPASDAGVAATLAFAERAVLQLSILLDELPRDEARNDEQRLVMGLIHALDLLRAERPRTPAPEHAPRPPAAFPWLDLTGHCDATRETVAFARQVLQTPVPREDIFSSLGRLARLEGDPQRTDHVAQARVELDRLVPTLEHERVRLAYGDATPTPDGTQTVITVPGWLLTAAANARPRARESLRFTLDAEGVLAPLDRWEDGRGENPVPSAAALETMRAAPNDARATRRRQRRWRLFLADVAPWTSRLGDPDGGFARMLTTLAHAVERQAPLLAALARVRARTFEAWAAFHTALPRDPDARRRAIERRTHVLEHHPNVMEAVLKAPAHTRLTSLHGIDAHAPVQVLARTLDAPVVSTRTAKRVEAAAVLTGLRPVPGHPLEDPPPAHLSWRVFAPALAQAWHHRDGAGLRHLLDREPALLLEVLAALRWTGLHLAADVRADAPRALNARIGPIPPHDPHAAHATVSGRPWLPVPALADALARGAPEAIARRPIRDGLDHALRPLAAVLAWQCTDAARHLVCLSPEPARQGPLETRASRPVDGARFRYGPLQVRASPGVMSLATWTACVLWTLPLDDPTGERLRARFPETAKRAHAIAPMRWKDLHLWNERHASDAQCARETTFMNETPPGEAQAWPLPPGADDALLAAHDARAVRDAATLARVARDEDHGIDLDGIAHGALHALELHGGEERPSVLTLVPVLDDEARRIERYAVLDHLQAGHGTANPAREAQGQALAQALTARVARLPAKERRRATPPPPHENGATPRATAPRAVAERFFDRVVAPAAPEFAHALDPRAPLVTTLLEEWRDTRRLPFEHEDRPYRSLADGPAPTSARRAPPAPPPVVP